MNEIVRTILNRRSVRKFTEAAVERELLEQVLQCGLYAPTGGNHQEVRFTVVEERALLEHISTLARDEFRKMPLIENQYHNKAILRAQKNPTGYDFTFHAPALIIVSFPRAWPNGLVDTGNAIENMQLAAVSLGLGCCWVNQLRWLTDNAPMRKYLASLGLPEEEEIGGAMVLGCPAASVGVPLPRKEGRITFAAAQQEVL